MCWLFHGDGLQPDGWPTNADENFGLRMVAQAIYVDLIQSGEESHRKVEVWDEKLLETTGSRFDLHLLGLALTAALEAFDDHAGPEARERLQTEVLRHLADRIAARDKSVPDDPLVHLDVKRWAAWVLGLGDLPGWPLTHQTGPWKMLWGPADNSGIELFSWLWQRRACR